MKADITFSQIYWNNSLLNFFFRTQSEDTMNELLDRAKDKQGAIDLIDEATMDDDLDDIEEQFYENSVEELAEEFCIELEEDEEEEEGE